MLLLLLNLSFAGVKRYLLLMNKVLKVLKQETNQLDDQTLEEYRTTSRTFLNAYKKILDVIYCFSGN